MNNVCAFGLFFLFNLSTAVFSQEDKPIPRVESGKFDSKVISINKINIDRRFSPFAEFYISEDQLRNQHHNDVTEAIRGVPGLHIGRTGVTRGTLTSLWTRGTNSNHTMVLMDGFKISRDGGQFFEYDLIDTSNLAGIEVTKGPVSALYGSDAVAGAVNFVTRRGGKEPAFELELAAGKFSTYKGRLGATGAFSNTSYSLDFTQWQRMASEFSHDDYLNRNFSMRIDQQLGDNLDLRLISRFTSNQSDLFTNSAGTKFQPLDPNARRDDNLMLNGIELNYTATNLLSFSVKYSNLINKRDNKDFTDASDFFNVFDEFTFVRNNVELGAYYNISETHRLYTGVELEDKKVNQTSTFGASVTDFNKNRGNYGYFIQDELQSGDWTFVNGIRIEDNQEFKTKTTGRSAASYRITDWDAKVRAGIGNSILEPTLSQNFGRFGSKNLDPEEGSTTELGFEKSFADPDLTASVTLFRTVVRDLIIFQSSTSRFANGGDILTQGMELSLEHKWGDLTAIIGYTLLHTRTLDDDGPSAPTLVERSRLLRRPNNEVNAMLAYKWERLDLNLDVNYTDKRIDSTFLFTRPSRETVDEFIKTDFAAGYRLYDTTRIYARIDNLFDVEYEDVIGYPSQGVTYLIGIISTL